LLALLDQRLESGQMVHLDVPLTDGAALAWLYQHGTVLTRDDDDSEAHLDVRLSEAELGRFHSRRISH
jgi:GTP-binding protein HflX